MKARLFSEDGDLVHEQELDGVEATGLVQWDQRYFVYQYSVLAMREGAIRFVEVKKVVLDQG